MSVDPRTLKNCGISHGDQTTCMLKRIISRMSNPIRLKGFHLSFLYIDWICNMHAYKMKVGGAPAQPLSY